MVLGADLRRLIFCLTFFDVRMSAKATVILGAIEIAVFMALGAYMIATETNSAAPFTPSDGANGWAGIFQGAYCDLAFIGFEAASALGEEAKNPRRTVPLGVIGSCVLVGLFYVFMTYSWNVGAKLDIVGHYEMTGGSDWDAFGNEYRGTAGAWIIAFALVNSVIACGTPPRTTPRACSSQWAARATHVLPRACPSEEVAVPVGDHGARVTGTRPTPSPSGSATSSGRARGSAASSSRRRCSR